MIKITFTDKEREIIKHDRFYYPHPRVQLKMEVLHLKALGLQLSIICLIAGVSPNTVRNYYKQFLKGGLEEIRKINFNKPQSELNNHRTSIEEHLEAHPPSTLSHAKAMIEELTGIKRSLTQIRKFLKNLGLKVRKVGSIPAKALTDKKKKEQEEFKNNQLEPRIKLAEKGIIKLFFVDAAHFVHGAFLGYVWSKVRLFIPTPSGRKRYNVLGAIDAITHKLIKITNESYINAESICFLLFELYSQNFKEPISIVLDNARYQKCELVTKTAFLLGIELLYLPSYSPHLNIIERLWKWIKKDCLYSKYYPEFKDFKLAIESSLNKVNLEKKEMKTLLNLKFQSFENTQIMTI